MFENGQLHLKIFLNWLAMMNLSVLGNTVCYKLKRDSLRSSKKLKQTIIIAGFAKIATKSMIKTGLNAGSVFYGFKKNAFIVSYCLSIRDISRTTTACKVELSVAMVNNCLS